jgi:hypothetical protein
MSDSGKAVGKVTGIKDKKLMSKDYGEDKFPK